MPATLTYPGVYVEEIPSGVRTIVGVATSITAFLGRALWGPVDQAVTINSFGDFQTMFGGMYKDSELGFAVRDFFLNGGTQAIIVRLFSDTVIQGGDPTTIAKDLSKAAADAASAQTTPPPTAADVATAVTTKATAEKAAIPTTVNGDLVTALKDMIDSIAKLATDSAAANPPPQIVAGAVTNGLQDAIDPAQSVLRAAAFGQIPCGSITLAAASPGTWAKTLQVTIDTDVSSEIATSLGLVQGDLFNLGVQLLDPTDSKRVLQSEFYRNVTVKASTRQLDEVLADQSDLIRYVPTTTGGANAPATPAAGTYTVAKDANGKLLKAGDDGGLLDASAFHVDDGQAEKKGLYALEDADLFNLLCIPPYNANDEIDYDEIAADVAAYCVKRRAVFIVDPPSAWTTKEKAVKGFRNNELDISGTDARNAAVFFPRLQQANSLKEGRIETFAPCGTVAGVFARTDTQRGVWKAPAGIDAALSGTVSLQVLLTDDQNGDLNPLGVNCLRTFPVIGNVAWGARTCRGADMLADEYKYIPIRRLALYIEESLFRGTKWVVFEPNDEPLWAQIRLNIGAFMQNLFRQGAFQGSSPRDAYFVKCDKETTTQNDRDLGIVNIVVGFAPLKPAEFVVLQIQQMPGDIQT